MQAPVTQRRKNCMMPASPYHKTKRSASNAAQVHCEAGVQMRRVFLIGMQ